MNQRQNIVILRHSDGTLAVLMAHSDNIAAARQEFDDTGDEILEVLTIPSTLNEAEQGTWDTLTRLLSYTYLCGEETSLFHVFHRVLEIVAQEIRVIGQREGYTEVSETSNILNRSFEELEVSVRTYNAIKNSGILMIGELVQKTEKELARTKGFSPRVRTEIKDVLEGLGLSLGMKVENGQIIQSERTE